MQKINYTYRGFRLELGCLYPSDTLGFSKSWYGSLAEDETKTKFAFCHVAHTKEQAAAKAQATIDRHLRK